MKKNHLLLLMCLCLSFLGFAQKQVSGLVTDEQGMPIPGVTVLVKNTTTGAVTNFDGIYSIEVPSGSNVLVFSYIGMKPQEIQINQKSKINVQMETELSALDEVVVIGYGSVKKSDLTGSVSGIKGDDIQESQPKDFLSAMQGRMAGVQISSESGEPGSGMNIKIRGQNSIVGGSNPLFVIDGVQIEVNGNEIASGNSSNSTSNPLSMINPSDIESIEVLKDASATAIFGSRGANGVVLITTKTGKSGISSFQYQVNTGVSTIANKIDVLSPEDYLLLAEARGGRENFLSFDSDRDGLPDTPRDFSQIESHVWQDEALRTAISQEHAISVSGGNEKGNYSAGLGYLSQEGLVKKNDFDRYNLRLKINHNQSDKFSIGFNLNASVVNSSGVANNGGPNSYSGITQQIVMANPWSIEDPDIDLTDENFLSPLRMIEEAYKNTRSMRALGSMNVKYKFTDDFNYTAILAGNYSQSKTSEFYNSNTNWGRLYDGLAILAAAETFSYNHSSQFNFNKQFGGHRIDALAAFEINHYNFESFRDRTTTFEDQSTGVWDLSKGENVIENSTERFSTNRLSYLGRINYNYKGRYFLTGSFRTDGSDKFGSGNRWGYFPSGAFAWRVSEENFLKDNSTINNLKFRLSYGKTGNESIPAYRYMARMENSYYTSNNQILFGLSPASRENLDLQWETTDQYNVGVDLGLFNNRVNITADYYLKDTNDMLLNAPVSAQSGYSNQWLNFGGIENEGFEFLINTVNIDTKDFTWESTFNISFNKNTVTNIGGAEFIPVFIGGGWIQNPGRVVVGESLGTMYGYSADGIYQIDDFTWQNGSDPTIEHGARTYVLKNDRPAYLSGTAVPGTVKYKDISGPDGVPDGQIDDTYDRGIIGNSAPKHIGGFNNNFKYKNFDLSFFLEWSYGNDIMNASKLREYGLQPSMNVTYAYFNDYWSPSNPSNVYPGLGQVSITPSSFFVEDGSYLRLKNVSLGYRLPKKALDGTGISDVRFTLVGTNLITWTNYSGLDPEVNSNNPLLPGFERFAYPRSRTITLGANIKF